MSGRVTDPRPPSALREHELLARLGLGPGASNNEVEAAHDEIIEYLGRAPGSLRGWARVQVTEADEAYARLNGAPASASAPEPLVGAGFAGEPADEAGAEDLDGFLDEPDGGPVVISRRDRRAQRPARAQAARSLATARAGGSAASGGMAKKLGIAGVAVVLVGALVVSVYGLGGGGLPGLTGTPKPDASAGIDAAQVSALMQKITDNPKDTASLIALANLYYGASDYANAETFLQKAIDVDPKNVEALLTLGAAQYNSGDDASAEANWRKVLAIDAKNLEAHYDLGFMYFSATPQDTAKAREEWGQVIALAPGSDIAQTVKTHLDSLGSPGPSTPSNGSPASGSPAPSPAAS